MSGRSLLVVLDDEPRILDIVRPQKEARLPGPLGPARRRYPFGGNPVPFMSSEAESGGGRET